MGVLYHLRHPLLALDLIREHVAGDLLLFQSMQRGATADMAIAADYDFTEVRHFDDPAYPKLHFIEHSYAGDPTNWWTPNAARSEEHTSELQSLMRISYAVFCLKKQI